MAKIQKIQKKNLPKPLKILTDQPKYRSDYSTVEENSTLVNTPSTDTVRGNIYYF